MAEPGMEEPRSKKKKKWIIWNYVKQRMVQLKELEVVLRRVVGNITGVKWLFLSYVGQE